MSESSYYYYTHSFTEDERQSLKEFFGRDLFGGSYTATELTDDQINEISSRIMPKVRSSLRVTDLLSPLRKLKALSDTEYSHLRSGSLVQEEQAARLMEYLMSKGTYGLACLYLSLLLSSESKKGLPAHYRLARELKDLVLEYGAPSEDSGVRLKGLTNGTETHTMSLRAVVKRLQGISLSPLTAQMLATNLGLPSQQPLPHDLCELCCLWLRSRSTCEMTELVEGIVTTEGLGRHTTRLCGPNSVPPRDLRNFLLTLGEDWEVVAKYLGYSSEEVAAIAARYPGSVGKQVDKFLEVWKMPDSGQKTLPLMHKLKSLSGIVEPKRDRADSLTSGRRPWLDESGVPLRRLDAYPHPPKRPPPTPPKSHSSQHNCPHRHHSHVHVHSIRHHHLCPLHGSHGTDERVEGYYDDYENTPHSSHSNTFQCTIPRGGSMRLTFYGGGKKRVNQTHYDSPSSGYYTTDDDPLIEELPSDAEDEPHPKPQRALMANEFPPSTFPPSSHSLYPELTTQTSRESTGSSSSYGRSSRTEMNAVLGNEVVMGGAPSHGDTWRQRSEEFERQDSSASLGNEVLAKGSVPLSGSRSPRMGRGRRSFERENSSGPLGNEVSPPGLNHLGRKAPVRDRRESDQSRVASSLQKEPTRAGEGERSNKDLLGNEVSMPRRVGVAKEEAGTSRSQSPFKSLGNEVPMPGVSRFGSRASVENGLPGQMSTFPSGGIRQRFSTAVVESSDSDYSTTIGSTSEADPAHGASSVAPRRRPLTSDSSLDSTVGMSSVTQPHQPVALYSPVWGVAEETQAPPNSRSASPDNNFVSGDEDESAMFSGSASSQPSSSQFNNLSPAPPSHASARTYSPTVTSALPRTSVVSPSPTYESQISSSSGVPTSNNSSGNSSENRQPLTPQQSVTTEGLLSAQPESLNDVVLTGGGGDNDADNDFDSDADGEGAVLSGSKISSEANGGQLSLPTTPQLPLERAGTEEAGESMLGSGQWKVGVPDNDLSGPITDAPNSNDGTKPAPLQTSHSSPDNDVPLAAAVTADTTHHPVLTFNDFSTEQAQPEPSKTTVPPPDSGSGEEITEYCSEDVLQAVQERNGMDMLTALVETGANINLPGQDGSYPIHLAVAGGQHETVLFLLNKGAKVDKHRRDGMTPLHIACMNKDFEMVQILVEIGADMGAQDKQGRTCLHLRETLETLNILRYLTHNGAPFDAPSHESYLTPLTVCCQVGDSMFDTAEFLIGRGASVDGCQQGGLKPLIVAYTEGFDVLVDLLLNNNANINIQDNDGDTALLKVCRSGSTRAAKRLCERRSDQSPTGVNVNLPNNEGLTPLLAAVLRNERELVVILITHGANVNCYMLHKLTVGGSERTLEVSPLSCAAASGNMEIIQLLIQNEANTGATATAMAPITIAAMCGHLAVVQHFLNLNNLDLSLPAMEQPFRKAVEAEQFECAKAIATKTFASLDEMCDAAQQNGMQELVRSIKQLENATTSGSSTVPPAHVQSSAPNSVSVAPPPQLPLPVPERVSSDEHLNNGLPVERQREDENNLDDEALHSPPESRRSGGVLPAPPAVSLPSNVVPAPVSVDQDAEVSNIDGENNLDCEDTQETSVSVTVSATPEVSVTVSLPTTVTAAASLPPKTVTNPIPSPEPSLLTHPQPENKYSDENNLDDEESLSPHELASSGELPAASQTSALQSSLAPPVASSERALLSESIADTSGPRETLPDNDLGADNDLDTGDNPALGGYHAEETRSEASSGEAIRSHRMEVVGGGSVEENDLNDLNEESPPGSTDTTERGTEPDNRNNGPSTTVEVLASSSQESPAVLVASPENSGGQDFEALNNISEENNLDDDDEVARVEPVLQTTPPTLSVPSPAPSPTVAVGSEISRDNNLNEDLITSAAVAAARDIVRAGGSPVSGRSATDTPVNQLSAEADADNDLNEESLTSSAATSARDSVHTGSNLDTNSTVAVENNLSTEEDMVPSTSVNVAVENNLSTEEDVVPSTSVNVAVENNLGAEEDGVAPVPSTAVNNLNMDQPVLSGVQPSPAVNNLNMDQPVLSGVQPSPAVNNLDMDQPVLSGVQPSPTVNNLNMDQPVLSGVQPSPAMNNLNMDQPVLSGVQPSPAVNNLNMDQPVLSGVQPSPAVNNLNMDQPVLSGVQPSQAGENNLTPEQFGTASHTSLVSSNNLGTGSGSSAGGRVAEVNVELNNLDTEDPDLDEGLGRELDNTSVGVNVAVAENNLDNVLPVGPQSAPELGRHSDEGIVPAARLVENENDLDAVEGQNNLDTDDGGVAASASSQPDNTPGSNVNNLGRSLSQPAEPNSLSTTLASSSLPSIPGTTSLPPLSNSVHALPTSHSPVNPVGANFPTSAPAAVGVSETNNFEQVPQSPGLRQHHLTEDNQFDEDENNLSGEEDTVPHGANQQRELQDRPPSVRSNEDSVTQVVPPEQRRVRWAESLVEERESTEFEAAPLPMSAPVGRNLVSAHSSGAPLRASVDTSSYTSSLPSHAGSSGENLFAPRPRSPPTRAPSPPPPPSPYNMLSMVDSPGEGLRSGGGVGFEVLHDFAQICMLAAVRTKGQEWLINKATETGFDHLTEFFLKYFHEGMSLSIGGKLVTEFIGGNPSPLNFLLAGQFINQAIFEEVARDLGQPDFMNDLTVALHQFPGSDGLPYTGVEMAEALFNQTFSIGHRYPDPSSLRSSSPPQSYAPSPHTSFSQGPGASSEPFSGTGHQLGRGSPTQEYSNLFEPAFNSATTSTSTAASASSVPATGSGPANSLTAFSQPSLTSTASVTSSSLSNSKSESGDGSGSHTAQKAPCPPPHTTLSLLNPSPPVTSGRSNLPSQHSLTEENVFDGMGGAQNDLTTDDEDSSGFYPGLRPAQIASDQLLGNEINVNAVSQPQPSSGTVDPTPSSIPPLAPLSSSDPPTLPHNITPLSPTPPPHSATSAPDLTPLSLTPPPDIADSQHTLPLSSDPLTPLQQPSEVVDTRPASLTPSPEPIPKSPTLRKIPSPEPIPKAPVKKTPTLVLRKPNPTPVASATSAASRDHITPQSSFGFESPRSPSPTPPASPPTTKTLKEAPPQASMDGKEGAIKSTTKPAATTGKDGRVPHSGVSVGGKTRTVGSSSASPTTRPKSTTVSKPPTVPATGHTKKTGVPSKLKTTTSSSVGTRSVSKVSAPHTKPQTSPSPRTAKKATPASTRVSVSSSRETPSVSAKTKKLPTQPTSKSVPSHVTRKPASSLPPNKQSSTTLGKTRVGRTSATTTRAVSHTTTTTARGPLRKSKVERSGLAGNSTASLTDEEPVIVSTTFAALESSGGSLATSPASSERNSDVVPGTSAGDIITFPDTVIRDPDTSALFKALAHRIQKWKVFGRYLGLSDHELDEIEQSNRFTTDRCLTMLVMWGRNFRGKYSELEAGIHNIMREDLVEDVRPLLPVEEPEQCREEECGRTLKFSGFSAEDGSKGVRKLAKSVTQFARRNNLGKSKKIALKFSHEKLLSPLEVYLPTPSSSASDCDLAIVEELCFAALNRSVSTVDLVFEV